MSFSIPSLWQRKWIRISSYSIAGLLVTLLLLFTLLQTTWVQKQLAQTISQSLSDQETQATLTPIEGLIPFDMKIAKFSISDKEGVWLQLEEARFDWSFWALLTGEIHIEALDAKHLKIARLPPSKSEPETDEPIEIPNKLPDLDFELPIVNIHHLGIEKIELGKSVVGQALDLTFKANAQTHNGKIKTQVELKRTDAKTLAALLNAEIVLKPLSVQLDFKADETGGLLSTLTGEPQLKDLHLTLNTKGLLSDWQAELKTQLKGVGTVNTLLKLGIVEKPWATLNSTIELQTGLLTKDILDVIGKKQQLDFRLFATDAETLELQQLSFNNDLLALQSNLNLNLAKQHTKASLTLELDSLKKLTPLAGVDLSGSSHLTAAISGSFTKPVIDVKLALKQLKLNDIALSELETNIGVETLNTLEDKQFKISLKGGAKNLTQQQKPFYESNLNWKALATTDEKQQLHLKNFQLDGDWSHLKLSGLFNTTKQQGNLKLSVNLDDLKAVTDAVKAKVNLEADIKIQPQIKELDIVLNSNIENLAGLPEPVSSLLGETLRLNSNISVKPEQSLKLSKLELNGKAVSLIGNTSLNLKNQKLNTQLNLNIPRLKTPDLNLQTLQAQINVKGSTEKPTIDSVLQIAELEAAGQQLKNIKLTATAKDVMESVNGELNLTAVQHAENLAFSTGYKLQQPQLKLTNLSFQAPKTRLTGELLVNLNSQLTEGRVDLKSELAGLKAWTHQDLAGDLNLAVQLKPRQQQQFVELNGQLAQLSLAELKIKSIQLDAQLENALKKPSIEAKLAVKDLSQQQTEVNSLDLNVSGLLNALRLELATAGQHQKPFALQLLAFLKRDGDKLQLQLEDIKGSVAKEKLKLAQSAIINHSPQKTSLSRLSLKVGSAELQAQADYSATRAVGEVNLTLPLKFVHKFVDIPLSGEAKANIKLSGTAKQPKIDLIANLNALRLIDFEFRKFPASELELKAQIKQPQLEAQLEIKNPQFTKSIQAQLQAPVKLQLEPFLFELPDNQTLNAQLQTSLDLAKATENLPLKNQLIKGSFNALLNVAGTLKQPQIDGNIRLTKGEYQNSATETYFKEIDLAVDATPEQIKVTSLKLRDANSGRLNGSGDFLLDESQKNPFKGQLVFKHLQLANSPNLQTHLSGQLDLNGNLEDALLKGQLNIDDFRFNLPSNSSQAEIPEMEVIEIGGKLPSLKKQLEDKKKKAKKDLKLKLDIAVNIAKQFFIQGHGLDSEWQGGLKITGIANSPQILGQIKTKRGSLELLNNRFVFERGIIDFNGAFPPMPTLDVVTATETDRGKAIIKISGMAKKPKLALSNNPNLPQDEILSNLLFGEDTKGISPMQALQLTDAVGMIAMGGLGSLEALGSVRSGLGLDRLSMGGDNFDTAAVKAGKYVTDSIYIEVEQGLTSESSTATVEIELLPDVKAEVEFNQQSDSAIGIKWKHDY